MTHGTLTGYSKHRCTCEPCRESWRTYQREYARERSRGERRMVDSREARYHLRRLAAAGLTQSAVCAASGVYKKTAHGVLTGKVKTIRRVTAERLLAVTLDAAPQCAAAMAEGMLAEIRGRAGWTNDEIEARLHITQPKRIARQAHVRSNTMAKILCAYRVLARRGLVDAELLEAVRA